MAINGTHKIQLVDGSNHHVCIVCGGCTCHTPNLLGISCDDARNSIPRIFDHKWIAARRSDDIHTDPVTLRDLIVNIVRGEFHDFEDRFKEESEIAKLRRKLAGDPEPVEESEAVADLATALVQTRDYVHPISLPAREGWAWYDALKKHAPHVLNEVLQADARAHARKTAESDENEMEDGDPTTND